MLAAAAKALFVVVWVVLFRELLFEPDVRASLLLYCQEHRLLAPLLLVLAQLGLASLALPCSFITALAGILWGFKLGFVYATMATLLSSSWTFAIGRLLLRAHLAGRLRHAFWRASLELAGKHGWKAAMIAHMNPALPGSSLGYVFGLSEARFVPFVLGAAAGSVPLQLLMIAVGRLALATSYRGVDRAILAFGLVLAVAIAAYFVLVPRLLRRAHDR